MARQTNLQKFQILHSDVDRVQRAFDYADRLRAAFSDYRPETPGQALGAFLVQLTGFGAVIGSIAIAGENADRFVNKRQLAAFNF